MGSEAGDRRSGTFDLDSCSTSPHDDMAGYQDSQWERAQSQNLGPHGMPISEHVLSEILPSIRDKSFSSTINRGPTDILSHKIMDPDPIAFGVSARERNLRIAGPAPPASFHTFSPPSWKCRPSLSSLARCSHTSHRYSTDRDPESICGVCTWKRANPRLGRISVGGEIWPISRRTTGARN